MRVEGLFILRLKAALLPDTIPHSVCHFCSGETFVTTGVFRTDAVTPPTIPTQAASSFIAITSPVSADYV